MKMNTDIGLVVLMLIVVAVIALSIAGGSQVDMAAARANAGIASSRLPEAAVIGGELAGWVLKTLLGLAAVAIGAGLIAWGKQWWKGRGNNRRAWRSGPNAQWQREPGPKAPTDAELMRTMLYQNMVSQQGSGGHRQSVTTRAPVNNDDDLDINF